MTRHIACLLIILAAASLSIGALVQTATSAGLISIEVLPDEASNRRISVELIGIGPGEGATGVVRIHEDPMGPDNLRLGISGLMPHARIAVFLTRHQTPGMLPAQFLGEFTTNSTGKGRLHLRAEIINAFASANQALEDALGEAAIMGAGDLAIPNGGSANTIPLNWIRGYFVGLFPHNVFGSDEVTPGGPPAFISSIPLP